MKLGQCSIEIVNDGYRTNGLVYQIGLNKRDWLYNCFVTEVNKKKDFTNIYRFIENALDPVNFTPDEKRGKYKFLFDGVNKFLLLNGLEMLKKMVGLYFRKDGCSAWYPESWFEKVERVEE